MINKKAFSLSLFTLFLLTGCLSSPEKTGVLEIEPGDSARAVAIKLVEQDLISRKGPLLNYLKSQDLTADIKTGRFVIKSSMTTEEIAEAITGSGGDAVLTFLEGWTVREMDDYLTEQGFIEEGDFLEAALPYEGQLFPDTYFINPADFTVESLIDRMKENFDEKFTPEMQEGIAASGRSLQEILIVASMIEEEVRTPQDAPIVSGIIWKRLDEDWFLGIDATLLYESEDRHISATDLEEDSPYNTRNRKGLPPTPISNPGLVSLKAAIFPEESPYYFYLNATDTGEVIYATTLEQHAANKAKYL